MPSAVTYQCPNCSAGLIFNPEKDLFCCEFCLSEFTEADLKKTEAGTKLKEEHEHAESEAFCEGMKVYSCPSCGAEIFADENTSADICCYCNNPVVFGGRLTGQLKPHKIVPFSITKEDAVSRFEKFAKKRWFAPWDFRNAENLEKARGVYYPFWVTDADTDSTYDTRARRIRVWRTGNVEYTETSEFAIHRQGDIHFEDITTSAYADEDKKWLEGILPYPSDKMRDYDAPYLQGFFAKKRNIERADVTDEVKGRMNSYATTLLRRTVVGYNSVDPGKIHVKVNNSNWDYTLLPVWVLTYKDKKGKAWRFSMNGETGKIYGKMPVAFSKLAILLGAVALPLTALFTVLGMLLF
ncbi:MAG: TFIIB-type zinc ribbon-containing protein [Clostridia bacterium]|nr:TFIIB-type zinc ribbon-containing protein [Clostridia bacterium]